MEIKNIEELKYEELIEKINQFSKLAKERDLNESEEEERQIYRKEYIRRIKVNMKAQLDTIEKK